MFYHEMKIVNMVIIPIQNEKWSHTYSFKQLLPKIQNDRPVVPFTNMD